MTFVHAGPRRSIKGRVEMTVDVKLDKLIKEIGLQKKPAVVDLSRKEGTAEKVGETRLNCALDEKDVYLFYFLKHFPGRTLVFCNSIDCIRRIVSLFTLLQFNPMPLHAAMQQRQRLKNVDRFAGREHSLLVASDVAARGLDIPDVRHVVHYQVPRTSETYIHRSGRTARADKQGVSVMLVSPGETALYQRICHNLNKSEHLPLFPIETKFLAGVKQRVQLGRDIETAEYRMKKEFRHLDWFQNQAREADIDFNMAENYLMADEEEENVQSKKKKKKTDEQEEEERNNEGRRKRNLMERELKGLKTRLLSLLAKPIFPTGFSGRYLTKEGGLNLPSLFNAVSEAGLEKNSALEQARKEIGKQKKLKASNPVVRAGNDNERTKARKKQKQKAKDERKKRNREIKGGGKKEEADVDKPTFTFEVL